LKVLKAICPLRFATRLLALALWTGASPAAELRVPAFTAYLLADADAAHISQRSGVTRWADPAVSVNWYGNFKQAGELTAKIVLRLPRDAESKLKLTVAGQSREVTVKGDGDDHPVTADFGSFNLAGPGYQRFALESLNGKGQLTGDLDALLLDGPALADAHFNLKERRNAASVHLKYSVPRDVHVQSFYCELTAVEDPLWTYYMACGWHRGYFGMQVNGPTERRIIFSVWDSGNEAVERNKVRADDRVTLVAKGEGVEAGDFGHEGTGGHSHLIFPWKTGEKQRFLVTAKPVDPTHTVYAGYYFRPDQKKWMLISSWNAPKDGGYLRGLHSFSENFGGANGNLVRKALYGNQWIQADTGQWLELTEANFSHDPTGKADRLDRFMGVTDSQFFLSHGGFIPGFTKYGEKFSRSSSGQEPKDLPPEITASVGAK
jgi:hypothetical protein